MKNGIFTGTLIVVFAVEIAALLWFTLNKTENVQDAVAVNEAVQSVREDWHDLAAHTNRTELGYVVINSAEEVVFIPTNRAPAAQQWPRCTP